MASTTDSSDKEAVLTANEAFYRAFSNKEANSIHQTGKALELDND